ncbi:hypothetical protein EYF80_039672 [Liparis tanakae]|uniref:Uncharacterized protein n=1 Tax=Liparis tanakae TaxID=230148 RepID=A0A4Z2G9E9_9TELE|nr:hypothetical protein EYF80_039672 [Liparis tanakae]
MQSGPPPPLPTRRSTKALATPLARDAHLPLVQLLRRGGPQADQAVVLDHGAAALARRGEALHLRHVVQALLDVAKVAGFGGGLFVRVRVAAVVTLLVLAQVALQAAALLGQLHLALLRKPPSCAAVTRGEGSNHSHDLPSRLRSVLTEDTVTEPEHRARISTMSLHQLTSTSG